MFNSSCYNIIYTNADLYTVNEPEKLEEVYLNTKSSLIIIGEDLTDDYKIALTRIKTLDRFAKFILVKNLDLQNLEGILKGIQNAYNKNLWEEETAIKDF